MDLISVIVPVYKVEPYLDRCVQSIVDQTYTHLEIILVDDGSPDRCPQMCDEWAEKDARIRVIHKENGGPADTRNAGIRAATGVYIAFVDSDDWVSKYYIERMYEVIRDTGTQMVACDVRFVYEDIVKKELEPEWSEYQWFTAEQAFAPDGWQKIRAVVWNKLYHHSLLKGEQFPVGKCNEDEFFTYRILDKAGAVVFVREELYSYFQRSDSVTHMFSMKHLDALEAYMERLCLFREKYPTLYVQEKSDYCIAFANYYCGALNEKTMNLEEVEQRIRSYRKQLRFSLAEMKRCSLKQTIYILCTGINLPLFCRLLNRRRGSAA